jgi:small subunit ribosomal protein S11
MLVRALLSPELPGLARFRNFRSFSSLPFAQLQHIFIVFSMSFPAARWLLPVRATSICSSCRSRLLRGRPFSSTTSQSNDIKSPFDQLLTSLADEAPQTPSQNTASSQFPARSGSLSGSSPDLQSSLSSSLSANTTPGTSSLSSLYANEPSKHQAKIPTTAETMHHLHVYATKHNTHITLTSPNRDALISVSTGNIGARKAQRGTYDAAYQLAAWVMRQIPQKGQDRKWIKDLKRIELVLRGFGPGREAVTKVLMGSEGREIRSKIVRVTDATRLKFGGVRSPAPRRLG